MQNNGNQNTIYPNTTEQILTQDKINVELIKKIMTEKKTILPSLRKQDWKKDKIETKKISKLLTNIPTNITKFNKLFYTGAKLVSDKKK